MDSLGYPYGFNELATMGLNEFPNLLMQHLWYQKGIGISKLLNGWYDCNHAVFGFHIGSTDKLIDAERVDRRPPEARLRSNIHD